MSKNVVKKEKKFIKKIKLYKNLKNKEKMKNIRFQYVWNITYIKYVIFVEK